MKEQKIPADIPLLCAKATSFPDGILAAFRLIEDTDPEFCKRKFHGLSRGNQSGGIVYWACVEKRSPDETLHGLENRIIKKGTYACREVRDFKKNTSLIGETFRELLKHPRLDPESYCVEIYDESAVKCMVRLLDS